MLVNFVCWVVFGLIAGVAAKFLMPGRDPGGFIATTALGVIGALVGGFFSSRFFGWDVTGFNMRSFAVAIGGALVLLLLYRVVMSNRQTTR